MEFCKTFDWTILEPELDQIPNMKLKRYVFEFHEI